MTGLGITGLAVGFAANQTISSVFGSISVMTDKVYKLGDYIVIDGYEGIVETVNFHSTKIRTVDNILITIPNNIMANSIVQNKSDAKTLKLIETFDIEYGTSDEDIEKAISLLNGICENMNSIQSGYQTLISKLAESSITLLLIADTTTPNRIEFLKIKNNIYKEALKQFRANGINFAFPSRTVYVQNHDEN
jgi:MscS family membrane protein